jgi:hypothetical protein
MKRIHGLWYIKECGVWLVAGTTLRAAMNYKIRADEITRAMQKARMGA